MIPYMKTQSGQRHDVKAANGAVPISAKGQVTIPKSVRSALGLKPLDRVTFEVRDGVAVVRPVPSFLTRFGSVKPRRVPEDFRKVRRDVARRIASQAANEGR